MFDSKTILFIIATIIFLGLIKNESNGELNIYVIVSYNILRAYSHFGVEFHSDIEMIFIKVLFLLDIKYVLSFTSNYYIRIWLLFQMFVVSLYVISMMILEIIGRENIQAIHDYRKKLERDYNRTQ